jgi:hypothetical protein
MVSKMVGNQEAKPRLKDAKGARPWMLNRGC